MLKEGYAVWQCGNHELSLTRPRIMGILNVTPDSFSDGGEHLNVDAAVARALEMLDEGADIIDVGGESTRPGHTPVSPNVEAERVVPVIRKIIAAVPDAIISIDTRHPEVAKMCVRLGASIINDVTGFTNPAMVDVAAGSNCGCVIMHWDRTLDEPPARRQVVLDDTKPVRTVPSSQRFTLPEEAPIMRKVMGFLGDSARTLLRAGIAKERICVDPGAGFDKDANQDVVIQRATRSMVSMGYPLMCAVSRKRFTGAVSGEKDATQRDAATIGIALSSIAAGARILRVHNVAATADAVNAYWAVNRKDPRQAFVSLGSNLGDRLDNLSRAVALIDHIPMTCVVQVSHAYDTAPAYGISSSVANAVVEIRTELHPLVLLDELLKVEDTLGRERPEGQDGFGDRTIDCDLEWVEGERHAGRKLTLPHSRMGERDYVILPMEDLMHDPARFFEYANAPVKVLPREQRVGMVMSDLGELTWE